MAPCEALLNGNNSNRNRNSNKQHNHVKKQNAAASFPTSCSSSSAPLPLLLRLLLLLLLLLAMAGISSYLACFFPKDSRQENHSQARSGLPASGPTLEAHLRANDAPSSSSSSSSPRSKTDNGSWKNPWHRDMKAVKAAGIAPQMQFGAEYKGLWPEFRAMVDDWVKRKQQKHRHSQQHHHHVLDSLLRSIKGPIDRHDIDRGHGSIIDPGHRYASCAVVGNSGILLNKQASHGALIDSHEAVFRLNNAITAGFEARVGSKTTIAFINSNILQSCSRRRYRCSCRPYGPDVAIVLYICQLVHLMDVVYCSSMLEGSAAIVVTDPRFDSFCSRVAKYYSIRGFMNAHQQDESDAHQQDESDAHHQDESDAHQHDESDAHQQGESDAHQHDESDAHQQGESDAHQHDESDAHQHPRIHRAGEWASAHDGPLFHYSSGFQAVMLALGICENVSLFGFGKAPGAKHHYHTNQASELHLHDYGAEHRFYHDLVHNRSSLAPFLFQTNFTLPLVQLYV